MPLASRRRTSPIFPNRVASASSRSLASILAFNSPCGFVVLFLTVYPKRASGRLGSDCGIAGGSSNAARSNKRRSVISLLLECKPRAYLNGTRSALTEALPQARRRLAKRKCLLRCRRGLRVKREAISACVRDVESVEHLAADLQL